MKEGNDTFNKCANCGTEKFELNRRFCTNCGQEQFQKINFDMDQSFEQIPNKCKRCQKNLGVTHCQICSVSICYTCEDTYGKTCGKKHCTENALKQISKKQSKIKNKMLLLLVPIFIGIGITIFLTILFPLWLIIVGAGSAGLSSSAGLGAFKLTLLFGSIVVFVFKILFYLWHLRIDQKKKFELNTQIQTMLKYELGIEK